MDKEDLKSLKTWGAAVLRMAEVAVAVGGLEDQNREALNKLEYAKKAADEAQAASVKAQGAHKALVAELDAEFKTRASSASNKHAQEMEKMNREMADLESRRQSSKESYMKEIEQLQGQVALLKQKKDELTSAVEALRAYAEKAKVAVHSVL